MTALIVAVGGVGTYLLYTSVVLGWRGVLTRRLAGSGAIRRDVLGDVARWLAQAGVELRLRDFAAATFAIGVVGGVAVFAVFGGVLPAAAGGMFAATAPLAFYRGRRERRRAEAREHWPRMIEEIRLQTSTLGRSIPQALFTVGRRAPAELQGAFLFAEREWVLTTDFDRTVTVLKERLADATADAALETMLVAHNIGGADLDRRLAALVEDRLQDVQGRKDARAKQAGVRFARRFVLLVPVGMAVAGLSIGTGRSAYATPLGQVVVAFGIAMVVACWVWAGRLLRLPEEQRVFDG